MKPLCLFVLMGFVLFAVAGFYGNFHLIEDRCFFAQFAIGCDMSGMSAYVMHHISGFLRALQSVPSELVAVAVAVVMILGVTVLMGNSLAAALRHRRRSKVFSYFLTDSEISMSHWHHACYGMV